LISVFLVRFFAFEKQLSLLFELPHVGCIFMHHLMTEIDCIFMHLAS